MWQTAAGCSTRGALHNELRPSCSASIGPDPVTLSMSPSKQLQFCLLTSTLGGEGAAATCCHWH